MGDVHVMTGKAWTTDEDDRLERLYRSGLRLERIGLKMGRSEASVANRACLLGLSAEGPRHAPAPGTDWTCVPVTPHDGRCKVVVDMTVEDVMRLREWLGAKTAAEALLECAVDELERADDAAGS